MQLHEVPQAVHDFLTQTRIGTFVHGGEPWPNAVPVWYEWTGTEIALFSRGGRPKIQHLREDPLASLLVSAEVAEDPRWVVVEGTATVDDDAADLAERLCDRYCDQDTAAGRALRADIMNVRADAVRIRISAERVRHFG